MKLKTWDEWEANGLHVIKGQRAVAYNSKTKALFSREQVTKTIHHTYDERKHLTEVSRGNEPEPERVYYADGSGYVNYGGPCGPLYFDRNGNT
jgi:hypothetical protein